MRVTSRARWSFYPHLIAATPLANSHLAKAACRGLSLCSAPAAKPATALAGSMAVSKAERLLQSERNASGEVGPNHYGFGRSAAVLSIGSRRLKSEGKRT